MFELIRTTRFVLRHNAAKMTEPRWSVDVTCAFMGVCIVAMIVAVFGFCFAFRSLWPGLHGVMEWNAADSAELKNRLLEEGQGCPTSNKSCGA